MRRSVVGGILIWNKKGNKIMHHGVTEGTEENAEMKYSVFSVPPW
jgi:hypothetical protein